MDIYQPLKLKKRSQENVSACTLKFIDTKIYIQRDTYIKHKDTQTPTYTYLFTLASIRYNRYLLRNSFLDTVIITNECAPCIRGSFECVCVCECTQIYQLRFILPFFRTIVNTRGHTVILKEAQEHSQSDLQMKVKLGMFIFFVMQLKRKILFVLVFIFLLFLLFVLLCLINHGPRVTFVYIPSRFQPRHHCL